MSGACQPSAPAARDPRFASTARAGLRCSLLDGADGALPQLGSVALQSGAWAAENILADLEGKARTLFAYPTRG